MKTSFRRDLGQIYGRVLTAGIVLPARCSAGSHLITPPNTSIFSLRLPTAGSALHAIWIDHLEKNGIAGALLFIFGELRSNCVSAGNPGETSNIPGSIQFSACMSFEMAPSWKEEEMEGREDGRKGGNEGGRTGFQIN